MKKLFLILFSVLTLFSCEKYIDMEIPDRGRKLVANCFFSDTGSVVVQVSMSRFILDNSDFNVVSDAIVVLYENGTAVDTLTETLAGQYITNGFIPQMGELYSLKIVKDTEEITASSSIPTTIPFEFIDTTRVADEYYEYLRFRIKINDPADEDNYYMIGFDKEDTNNDPYYNGGIYFYSEEPFIESYNHHYGLFSDILFKGQSQILAFDLDLYNFDNDTNKVNISLFSISKEMFMYLLTLQAQQNAGNSPFAEPVMVFSNIENGYGIFAGFSIYQDSITIPRLGNEWGIIE